MNWLRKFMIGRYGQDQLSTFLLVVSICLTLIGQFTRISLFIIISYIPLFIAISRFLSKDIHKRRMENYKFSIFTSPIYSKFKKIQKKLKDSKTNKLYKCKECNMTLRVPKGKGKILVTCPKCRSKFTKKT